jgi:hypothetical protein
MSTAAKGSKKAGATPTSASTARVTVDDARIDRLKELLRSTPQDLDFERVRIMHEMYGESAGDVQILRRAKFLAAVLERKTLYIDDNLFVGAMGGKLNAVYTYPEWQVDWMVEEKTVENSPTPEDKAANQWALEYWGQRAMKPRTESIFQKRFGYDPKPCYNAGLIAAFHDWPAGGGNLDYPRVYREGLASMIKEVEERQMALEMRLPNLSKFGDPLCPPLRRAGPGDGGQGEGRNPQSGIDRDCRNLRMGARASRAESAGSHPEPLPVSHRGRTRAGRLRLLRGIPRPKPRAFLSGRQDGRTHLL